MTFNSHNIVNGQSGPFVLINVCMYGPMFWNSLTDDPRDTKLGADASSQTISEDVLISIAYSAH